MNSRINLEKKKSKLWEIFKSSPKPWKAHTLKATYSSVLFDSWREHEICFFNSTSSIKEPKISKKRTHKNPKTKRKSQKHESKPNPRERPKKTHTWESQLQGLDPKQLAGAHLGIKGLECHEREKKQKRESFRNLKRKTKTREQTMNE